jgi:hypothetical protein
MDEKCWFVLRQRHYPPPTRPPEKTKAKRTKEEGNEPEEAEEMPWQGPICLGHIIQSPKRLDQVKNRSGLKPYPADMPVYYTQTWHLTTEIDSDRRVEASAKGEGPAGATPVDLSLDVATVFRKTVQNHSQFERLDTMIFQPTDEYVKDVVKDPDVQKLIGRMRANHLGLNTWSLYMISGIAVAVGASGSREETLEKGASGEGGAEASGIAGGRAQIAFSDNKTTKMSFKKASDFVWALRLHRISKNLFASDITDETYIKGAAYGRKEAEEVENIRTEEAILEEKGLNPKTSRLVYAEGEDVFLIYQQDSTEDGPDSDDDEAKGDAPVPSDPLP